MRNPAWKAQFNGARYGVWYLDGYTYEGYDWINPIYRQVAEFDTLAEAEQAATQAAAADTSAGRAA
jgi:hypothetical protein